MILHISNENVLHKNMCLFADRDLDIWCSHLYIGFSELSLM